MKTPLANKAAMAIINSTCNPALRHGDAHNVTTGLCAEIITRETAADELLEVANRHRHLLSELHGGNAFSKDWLWQALTETDIAIAKVQPTTNPQKGEKL